MAKIKKIPVGLEAIGTKVVVNPKFREVLTGNGENFVPYREFEVSGDQQNSVTIRVYGIGNSDIPKTKGLTMVKSVNGLNFVTRLVGRKEEIQFEASELRFEK
ncbi:hypothetical protein [Streptococcus pseudopneumoniae]|uniref:hypothetical protein n=1 Tax=Streptococcus pseudopneumoniae TaxID=257758 RepID=UPI00066A2299|nr:hypothetical protein [Streptococcus pseudopneumoniae]